MLSDVADSKAIGVVLVEEKGALRLMRLVDDSSAAKE